jgi:hypothetical protein
MAGAQLRSQCGSRWLILDDPNGPSGHRLGQHELVHEPAGCTPRAVPEWTLYHSH